jgi:hypothetical protein
MFLKSSILKTQKKRKEKQKSKKKGNYVDPYTLPGDVQHLVGANQGGV